MAANTSKLFIIGLPRTGTTSVCVGLLDLGFKVAHCAVTDASLLAADAIGDTPAYCDFKSLDQQFPGSRFIYLEREMKAWLPSVKSLLLNMIDGLNSVQGGFPDTVKRCYSEIFQPITTSTIVSDKHLRACYSAHRSNVRAYFQGRQKSIISLDISHAGAYRKMIDFLQVPSTRSDFRKMNAGGQIVSWRQIQHKNKIRFNL